MRILFLVFLFCIVRLIGLAQNKNVASQVEIIKVKQDSIAWEIENGKLYFLNDRNLDGWTTSGNVNGLSLDYYQSCRICFKNQLLKAKKGQKFGLKDIKMKKTDGKLYIIGSKRIEII